MIRPVPRRPVSLTPRAPQVSVGKVVLTEVSVEETVQSTDEINTIEGHGEVIVLPAVSQISPEEDALVG